MKGRRRAAAPGIIRRAVRGDLDSVEALENAVFDRDRLSRRSLRFYIDSPTVVFLIVEIDGTIVADALVAFRRGSKVARLYSLAVHPAFTGRGLGQRLLNRCETEAAARGAAHLRLEVRLDNATAIQLYGRAGYATFGRYDDYYEDGAAALRFEKSLVAVDGGERTGPDGGP